MPTAPHPRHFAELASVLDRMDSYLQWKKEEGVTRVELSDAPPNRPTPALAPEPAAMAAPRKAEPKAVRASGQLEEIATTVASCTLCPLHKTRNKTVPGQGNPKPELMFVGEGPGADEDRQGLAFVGRAGQLLTKMIQAMGLTREEVFIGNIVKCRPPGNRVPTPEEMAACMPYLHQQIALLKPKVIVSLGATAAQGLIPSIGSISAARGKWREFQGIDLMPTYHPAYLLRNPPAKRFVWEDLQEVMRRLGRPVPKQK